MSTVDATNPPAGALRVGVIAGSTRPRRRSPAIAHWVASDTSQDGVRLKVIDLAEVDLPLLREPVAAAFGQYELEGTRRWASQIATYDAFVLVTPEYNASFPAVLKNALDHLYAEWHHKPVAFVGYGMSGGIRAVEQLRLVAAELHMHALATSLALSPHQVIDGRFHGTEAQTQARAAMVADLARLGRVLRPLRGGEDGSAA